MRLPMANVAQTFSRRRRVVFSKEDGIRAEAARERFLTGSE
jgi:hypothetical protein